MAKTLNSRRTMLGIREGVDGWLEFNSIGSSMAEYLNSLAEADRVRVMARGGESADRYLLYLGATGRDAETVHAQEDVAGLGGRVQVGADGVETLDGRTREEWSVMAFSEACRSAEELGLDVDAVAAWACGA